MKKNYLLALTGLILTFSAGAQFTKGDRLLGAGFNFSHSKSETSSGFTPYNSSTNNGSLTLDMGFASRENRFSGFYVGEVTENPKRNILHNLPLTTVLIILIPRWDSIPAGTKH